VGVNLLGVLPVEVELLGGGDVWLGLLGADGNRIVTTGCAGRFEVVPFVGIKFFKNAASQFAFAICVAAGVQATQAG
jgi:hypothetical protein